MTNEDIKNLCSALLFLSVAAWLPLAIWRMLGEVRGFTVALRESNALFRRHFDTEEQPDPDEDSEAWKRGRSTEE